MDLLDVFGGQDNLVLMCGVTQFHKEARNCVSFYVDIYRVRLQLNTSARRLPMYHLGIFDRVSGKTIDHVYTNSQCLVRDRFECHTGYSLSF
jgi:hypothetical protein